MKAMRADGQFVLSRANHHIHFKDEKTGERVPLNACIAKSRKKAKVKECKHGAPWKQQLTSSTKVVCRGVAKTHGLKCSGQWNALGSFLHKRRDCWFASTAAGLAIIFRSNTNTQWTWRVPITECTHFASVCRLNCLGSAGQSRKSLLVAASRAARQMVGYFCGYTCKRQVVGKYELDQAAVSMHLLSEELRKDSSRRQLARVTNRMLSDLQCRGMLRTATEEVNLAANSAEHDEMNAEFIRTFRTQAFFGRRFLERLEKELKQAARDLEVARGRVGIPNSRSGAPAPRQAGPVQAQVVERTKPRNKGRRRRRRERQRRGSNRRGTREDGPRAASQQGAAKSPHT